MKVFMKTKVFFGVLLSLFVIQSAFSSGALRFILPYLNDIAGMKEGELAYDSVKKGIAYKNDSGVYLLANNVDKTPYFSIPEIETTVNFTGIGQGQLWAYVHAGKIRIGNMIYSNVVETKCVYDQASPNLGIGYFDGSAYSGTFDSSYIKPSYLYLVADGSGFKCIFSHNVNGLSSPYNNLRWLRAASYVGSVPSYFRTNNFFTKAYQTSFSLSSLSVVDLSYLILPSMKSIRTSFKCTGNQEVNIMERFHSVSYSGDVTYFWKIAKSCFNGSKIEPFDFYPAVGENVGEFRLYGDGTGPFYVDFEGWQEIFASSV